MLFNPKWDKKADPFSRASVIAWLETKDPNEAYAYWDRDNCLIAQYLRDHQIAPSRAAYSEIALHLRGAEMFSPSTFGQALARARAM